MGAFATLYFAAIALITLLFRMIDYAFPDALRDAYYYADPYSGPMRFAIASLIILVPVFLFLMRTIQKETRATPERQALGVRRWLTYITLFIAGATIVGDLIALLNSYLAGELATAFLLKALVLFLIMGAGFWYFLLDIRGYWQKRERISQTVGGGVLVAVVAVIVGGFFIMGSPAVQREVRLDQEQVNDLSMIQYQVVDFWQQNGRLPQELAELESDITGFRVPTAPADREVYRYEVRGSNSFALCAIFARASDVYSQVEAPSAYGIRGALSWEHEVGETCFERTIDPALIKPVTRP